jgi:branched-chain amino acid transport system substrate-binding protein
VDYAATKSPKPQTVGIVIMDDPVYHEMAAGVRERCAANGMKVVFEEVLPMNVQDLRPAVLKMKRAGNIDMLVNTGWDVICTKLVEEMSTLGFNPKAFDGGHLTTSPSVKQALGRKMTEMLGVNFWMPQMRYKDPHFKSCQEFHEAFLKAYGYAPTYHAAMAYTIPVLYQQVLADADPADPFNQQKVREKLLKLQMETIWGPVSFNERGRIRRAGVPVIQWLGDDPAPTIVFPSELAQQPGVYPRRPWA